MPLPTTRRGRFLYRRHRYMRALDRLRSYKWQWVHSNPGGNKRQGLKTWLVTPGMQRPCDVSSASYNATPHAFPPFVLAWEVTAKGRGSPPHVKITSPLYLLRRADGQHQSFAFLEYHARSVRAIRKLTTRKRSAHERKITGANWHLHREGYFPDWDVLGRHPNMTDAAGGAPPYPLAWPVPLGY